MDYFFLLCLLFGQIVEQIPKEVSEYTQMFLILSSR